MTSVWTAEQVARIDLSNASTVPPIPDIPKPIGGETLSYWDMWPVQAPNGRMTRLGNREMWLALTAPLRDDPELRHFEAKIRWLERDGENWIDRGPVLPDRPVPYEREWAGSALLDSGVLTLFFTGAGVPDRTGGYQQQLYQCSASVARDGSVGDWSAPLLCVETLTPDYRAADAHDGTQGRIKAFRDPAFFRDPHDGQDYLLFTASLGHARSEYNGAVGLARRTIDGWELLPPVIHADAVNNELERAHAIWQDGRYYILWVTQRSTFAPDGPTGPTGLYGMVSDSLRGDYRPINGHGLILANPETDPQRAYSWFASAEGIVSSFVDRPGGNGFRGVPAPLAKLHFHGDDCSVLPITTA